MEIRELLREFAPSHTEFNRLLNDSSIRMGFEVELVTNAKFDEDEDEDNHNIDVYEVYEELADSLGPIVNKEIDLDEYYSNPDIWHIVEDGSIHGDGIGAEIVSSVYPLKDGIDTLGKIFNWMQKKYLSTNKSTGLHVSFSILGKEDSDEYDFLKMMVLFDENYTANLFDRIGQYFCKQMRETLFKDMHELDAADLLSSRHVTRIAAILKQIGSNLPSNLGHSKYYTFRHRSNGIIEFRSMGGAGYEKRLAEIRKRIINMAYLMKVGSDPNFMAREYVERVYKMLTSSKYSQAELGSGSGQIDTPSMLGAWKPYFDGNPQLLKTITKKPASFLQYVATHLLDRLTPIQIKQLRFFVLRNRIAPEMVHRALQAGNLGRTGWSKGDDLYNKFASMMRWPLSVAGDERQQTLPFVRPGPENEHRQNSEYVPTEHRQLILPGSRIMQPHRRYRDEDDWSRFRYDN